MHVPDCLVLIPGKGVAIERVIVDKNVTIGDFCHIADKRNAPDKDEDYYYVRGGITIIRRGINLAAHTVI